MPLTIESNDRMRAVHVFANGESVIVQTNVRRAAPGVHVPSDELHCDLDADRAELLALKLMHSAALLRYTQRPLGQRMPTWPPAPLTLANMHARLDAIARKVRRELRLAADGRPWRSRS